jgi:hypothetical protein
VNESAGHSQQVEAAPPAGSPEPLTIFLAVGIVINLALVTAFLLWAIRHWKRHHGKDS